MRLDGFRTGIRKGNGEGKGRPVCGEGGYWGVLGVLACDDCPLKKRPANTGAFT